MLEKNGGIPYNTDMSTYPGAIDEFRRTANIQGVVYNAADETTVFAEDTNSHSDAIVAIEETLGENPQGDYLSVADRLAASGGGGGAWEQIFNYVCTGSENVIEFDGLDLVSDEQYQVFFSVGCDYATSFLELWGTNLLSMAWSGSRWSSGSLDYQTGLPFISHQSVGPGTGKLEIVKMLNGSTTGLLEYIVGAGRNYRLMGADSNWYSGGENLTKIKFQCGSSALFKSGSYVTIFKKVSS